MEPIYGFSVYAPIKRTKTDANVDYFTDNDGQMIFRYLSCSSLGTDLDYSVNNSDVSMVTDLWDVQ